MSVTFPTVRLGHRDRRAPDRGRQLEQRLVGVGAHARHRRASSRAATRATRCNRYADDIALVARPRASALPLLDRVVPHRARGGRVLAAALDHYRRDRARPARARHRPGRHVPPLHDAALGGGRRRLGRPDDRRPVRRASASAPSPTSATSSRRAARSTSRTSWRSIGLPVGLFPPGHARPRRYADGRTNLRRRAPHGGRRDQGAAPGDSRSGYARRWATSRRVDGGEAERDADPAHARRTSTSRPPRRRLRRRAGLLAHAHRSRRPARAAEPGVEVAGRWATSSGRRRSRRRSAARGSTGAPPVVRHRERHRHRRRRAAHRVRAPTRSRACRVPRRRHRRARLHRTGRCSTTSSGPSATCPVRPRCGRPRHLRAHAEAVGRRGSATSPAPTPG